MVKTTKEFIKQFKLNEENFEFNREDFLTELYKYFLEILYKSVNPSSTNYDSNIVEKDLLSYVESGRLTWEMFKHGIKQTEQKFWSISNKKVGLPFSRKLWGAFYAIHVIKVRSKLFPKIEEEIKFKREKRIKNLKPQD